MHQPPSPINVPRLAKKTGINASTLRSRLERGVPLDKLHLPPGGLAKRLHEQYPAEYKIWAQIKHRCKDAIRLPRMELAWEKFEVFLRDVGPRPSPHHQLRLKNRATRYYSKDTVHWVPCAPRLPRKVTGRLDWLLKATPPED